MRDLNVKPKMKDDTKLIHPMASGKQLRFDQSQNFMERASQSRSMADMCSLSNTFKRSNQKTDSLIKTLFDSTVPPEVSCALSFP